MTERTPKAYREDAYAALCHVLNWIGAPGEHLGPTATALLNYVSVENQCGPLPQHPAAAQAAALIRTARHWLSQPAGAEGAPSFAELMTLLSDAEEILEMEG